jgi:hypothetical protein
VRGNNGICFNLYEIGKYDKKVAINSIYDRRKVEHQILQKDEEDVNDMAAPFNQRPEDIFVNKVHEILLTDTERRHKKD